MLRRHDLMTPVFVMTLIAMAASGVGWLEGLTMTLPLDVDRGTVMQGIVLVSGFWR